MSGVSPEGQERKEESSVYGIIPEVYVFKHFLHKVILRMLISRHLGYATDRIQLGHQESRNISI